MAHVLTLTGLGPVQVTGKLNAVERGLLSTRVAKLRATLDPALTIQNWHSLGILDFVASVNKVLHPAMATSMLYSVLSKQSCLQAQPHSAVPIMLNSVFHTLPKVAQAYITENLLLIAVRGTAQAIGEFEVLVQQVQKNASLIEHAISAISHAKACAGPPAGSVLDLQELQEHIETHRVKVRKLS